MNYPMYGNNNAQFYMQDLQSMKDRIDAQMKQIQQQQQPQQQIPQINQNFQLAPQPNNNEIQCKYVDNIEDVKNTFVMKIGIFVNKDFTNLWVKNVNGDIRTFKTEEIIEMDNRDKEIYELRKQVEEMKGMINNANKSDNAVIDGAIEEQKPTKSQINKRSNAK